MTHNARLECAPSHNSYRRLYGISVHAAPQWASTEGSGTQLSAAQPAMATHELYVVGFAGSHLFTRHGDLLCEALLCKVAHCVVVSIGQEAHHLVNVPRIHLHQHAASVTTFVLTAVRCG